MVELYGKARSRRDIAASAGSFSQFAGVRLMTLGDGVERGIRLLEFRTGTGLRFTVLIDRALDIADCDYKGMAIGWNSPAGFKHPGLHEYEGEGGLGWLRSFSGLMVTCGLDHILFMADEPGDTYVYGPRKTVSHSLHGRIGTIPAKLTGYGERWEGDDCILWCEGSVMQGTVFGEHLELIRRIEIKAGTNDIRLTDRVVNRGFYRTPHMFCYHINVGHPVLSENSRYIAPLKDVVWAAHAGADYRKQGVGYRTMPAPQLNFHEQVWQHDMTADANGEVPVALVNDALGIEPSTNHVLGHTAARERGELIWLEHGDERRYDTTLRILGDAEAIAASEARIGALARQPSEEYPQPSGNHLPIGGRA